MTSTQSTPSPAYMAADTSGRVVAATTVILTLTTVLLCIRLWARHFSDVRYGWNDILLLPCWLLVVGGCVTAYLSVHMGGAGRHIVAALADDPNVLVTRAKLIYALSWFCGVANLFSRLSILLLYLSIFRGKVLRLFTYLELAYLVGFFIATAVVTAVQCIPVPYNWTQYQQPPGQGRSMINQFLYFKLQGLINVGIDIGLLFLPIPIIWELKASTARKAGLAVVFASGSLGLIASIIRTSSFFTQTHLWHTDPTRADTDLISWTVVESGMYLIAASLIGSRPFFARGYTWLKSMSSSRSGTWKSWGFKRLGRQASEDSLTQPIQTHVGATHEKNCRPCGSIMVQNEYSVERKSVDIEQQI